MKSNLKKQEANEWNANDLLFKFCINNAALFQFGGGFDKQTLFNYLFSNEL